MSNQPVSIKYNIDQIFACKDANFVMPKELAEYCSHYYCYQSANLSELIKSMDDITKSHANGTNPNDVAYLMIIRENLNKLTQRNFDDVLKNIKSLAYSSTSHFTMLATEIVVKCMNDPLASKGVEPNTSINNRGNHEIYKSPSELYMDIASHMWEFLYEPNNNDSLDAKTSGKKTEAIKFKVVLSKVCQDHFKEFTNKSSSMDNNNPHRVSIYKGFMNMIGLLYSYGLFSMEIVNMCFKRVNNLILRSELSQEETDNYFSGIERLMNRILTHYEKLPVNASNINDFNTFKPDLRNVVSSIQSVCHEREQKNVKLPIRAYSLIVLEQITERLDALSTRLSPNTNTNTNTDINNNENDTVVTNTEQV